MRMEKKGIKKVSGFGHGDHYINIKVVSVIACQYDAAVTIA